MELFWNECPDKNLSDTEMAEKRWCLANERLKKLEAFCVTQYGYYNEQGVIVECDDEKYLDALRQQVATLWNEYVLTKPNVSEETKKKLGLLKEPPVFNLEKIAKLSKKRTFEDLTGRVQQHINTATYREEELCIPLAGCTKDDVSQVVKALRSQGFDVDFRNDFLRIQYKY